MMYITTLYRSFILFSQNKKRALRMANKFLFASVFFLIPKQGLSQVVTTYPSNTTFTVPVGVTSLKVECWGAGGKGSNLLNAIDVGGGGGGGAYSSSLLCVVPGETYAVAVGIGGTGATPNGGDSYFGSASTVMAKGGAGLSENINTGALGAKASESVGQIKYDGGNGGSRTSYIIVVSLAYRAGGGGGGAGSSGAGNSAVGITAGATKTDNGGKGGDGIDGGLLNLLGGFTGIAGSNYGGGGSGAGRGLLFSSSIYEGGNGAPGLVRITYEEYACQATMETTWNGTVWSNGTPQGCKKAIINGNYNTSVNGSFTACSCQIMAGKTLTVGNGTNTDFITIYNQLENGGTLVINNNASLLQHYSFKNNAGNIAMHRYTKPMYRYDYTYWSSPLTADSNFTLQTLSPLTLSDKYYSWNATTQSWSVIMNGTETMVPGKGYGVRAPQTFSTNPSTVQPYLGGVFTGKPNNGNISYGIVGSNSADPLLQKWNLVGNPYPSAIDIEQFLLQNNTVLDGTAYVWTHNSPPNSSGSYVSSDYAVYNFSGSVGTTMGVVPTKYFAAGQSFFVKGIFNGNTTATFNNKMRVSGFNSQFYRLPAVDGKHRIWLNLQNAEGAFSQALVGYIENATNGLDWGYDADLFGGNYVTFYSLLDGKELSINGRALPFNDQDFVPLGYKTELNGNLIISIGNLDGEMTGRTIYLEDRTLGIIHDLKQSDYSFETLAGTFNNRFVLRYTNEALGINNPVDPEICLVYKDRNQNIIVSLGTGDISQIRIFDISGRLVHDAKNINRTKVSIENLPAMNQILLVEVQSENRKKFIKKIIF